MLPQENSPTHGEADDDARGERPAKEERGKVEPREEQAETVPVDLPQDECDQRSRDEAAQEEFQPRRAQKLIRSFSTTSGRRSTCVWIAPMYSPRMPMKKSWTDENRNNPMITGACPIGNSYQFTSL